jgi:hypothetical protein
MTNDASVLENALKSCEAAVREAVAEFGAQHPEVLKRLERYVTMLRRAERTAQADKLEEKAKTLRKLLGAEAAAAAAPAPGLAVAPAAKPAEEAEPLSILERALFNSRGEHVAMELDGHLYSPEGKYIGYWSADMEAYISKDGHYIGQVVEEDRLARDPSWRFKNLTFGRGYEGDRRGWHRVGDTYRVTLPYGLEDADI